jgi:uncharacterized protein with HEPN domain
MRPEPEDAALLRDMLNAAQEATGYVAGMTAHAFAHDRRTQRAVERCIEIVGEAARGVSRTFQAAHPEIPWRPIVAQRHILAHEYGDVLPERLYRVATTHLPALAVQLGPLVSPDP